MQRQTMLRLCFVIWNQMRGLAKVLNETLVDHCMVTYQNCKCTKANKYLPFLYITGKNLFKKF